MLRYHFNGTLTKVVQSRLINSQQSTNVQRQFIRFARTKAINGVSSLRSNKVQPTISTKSDPRIIFKPLSESQISAHNKQRVKINRDELLIEQLNIARPGTATDHRYKQQAKVMATLDTEEERIQSLFVFLAQEALLELELYPNPDEVTTIDDIKEGVTLEEQMEYEMKKNLANQWNISTERYKRFEILLAVLEKLHAKSNGGYLVPVEILVALFDASKYITDAEKLQAQIRYLCGDLIYSLKKFEFDIINESFYVESLMRFGFHKRAKGILLKREAKLLEAGNGQRWWGDLIIINQIDMKDMVAAEEYVTALAKQFDNDYLDPRVYSAFVKAYVESDNFERTCSWIERLNKSVTKSKGFSTSISMEEPGLDSNEEAVLAYLNREDIITKEQYLAILETVLESEQEHYQPLLSHMIDFYLKQPHTSLQKHTELVELLLKFRFEYKNKIKPILQAVPSTHQLSESLIPLLKQLRALNPTETSQADLLDGYFNSLSKVSGGFSKIISEMKNVMKSEDGKLTSKNYYSLISALIKAKQIDQAYSVLQQLENAKNELEKIGDSNDSDKGLWIPVTTNHYVPFLRHYGRTSQMVEFHKILKRFQVHNNPYNPVILTQVINSLAKNKQHDGLLKFIRLIALEDIHLQDPSYLDKPLNVLYSSIWACLSSYLKNALYLEIKEVPDLRYIFIKMTQESQVIPNRKDYENIVTSFLRVRDFYSALCVLELMGSRHKVLPSIKILQEVDQAINKIENTALKYSRDEEYSIKLEKLRQKRIRLNTLDPFAIKEEQEKRKDLMEDYLEPELELTDKQKNLYKLPILKLYDALSKTYGFDDVYMKQIWREFGLEGVFNSEKLMKGFQNTGNN